MDMTSADLPLGIDSLVKCSAAALANAGTKSFLGRKPAFWGRYFYAPGQMNSGGKKDSHYSASENAFLRSNNIRLLPVARQTGNVSRDAATAVRDAKRNVDALFETIPAAYLAGADPTALVFLDVEPGNSLASAYYVAWAQTISDHSMAKSSDQVHLRPGIYANPTDAKTWKALRTALSQGSACYGVWMARYYYGSPVPPDWNDKLVTPSGGLAPPILAWQYWASADNAKPEFNFDTSSTNPAHFDALLDGLIMPPAG
jgi:hypothetical protein